MVGIDSAQILIGVSTGLASAGTVTFAFGLVIRVMGGRIDRVEAAMEKKLDASDCGLKHGQVVKDLARGTEQFDAIQKELSAQGKVMANIDGKMELLVKQTGGTAG